MKTLLRIFAFSMILVQLSQTGAGRMLQDTWKNKTEISEKNANEQEEGEEEIVIGKDHFQSFVSPSFQKAELRQKKNSFRFSQRKSVFPNTPALCTNPGLPFLCVLRL